MACGKLGVKGSVLMMDFCPPSRAEIIRKLGCDVEMWPSEKIFEGIAQVSSHYYEP